MKQSRIFSAFAMMALCVAPLFAADPVVVTFDNDTAGFDFGPDCTEIVTDGDESYLNFSSICDEVGNLRGWFNFYNNFDEAWIGDYSAKGPVRISVDVDVELYDFLNFGNIIPAEEFRELVIEFVDFDNPAAGYPYTSVWINAGALPARDAGWKNFTIEITDADSVALPEGWGGTGAEDPVTYEPTLPDHRTYADVLASVDEIRFTTLVPGFFYSFNFLHSINIDNLTIEALPQSCNGMEATIFVEDGRVVGGPLDGHAYFGALIGTGGDDVIIGTDRRDLIFGFTGNDTICGRENNDGIFGGSGADVIYGEAGDDRLIGGMGNDTIDGGEGDDLIYGGPGSNDCHNGETTYGCGAAGNGGASLIEGDDAEAKVLMRQ